MTDANDTRRNSASLEEQLNHAAEELITGDSDDPPLSEEAVFEMLRMPSNVAGSDRSDPGFHKTSLQRRSSTGLAVEASRGLHNWHLSR